MRQPLNQGYKSRSSAQRRVTSKNSPLSTTTCPIKNTFRDNNNKMIKKSLFQVATILAVAALVLDVRSSPIPRGVNSGSDACNDCNCVDCVSRAPSDDDAIKFVTISLARCKGGGTISWVSCCADANCLAIQSYNSPKIDSAKKKCDELTLATFNVSSTATTLTLHVHDGQFEGDGTLNNGTCAAGKSACANHGACTVTINLSTCPLDTNQPPQCSSDTPCPTGPCGTTTCNGTVVTS